ncbi:MAG TPA: DUF1016 N-terminal domain-containing protein [Pirellulales bacterium]|nr:DUF1016 N-terminal domain-containing protein [Pirellulales bacterium]
MTYRLIDVYWQIGEHISRRITTDGWGQGTVQALAEYIRIRQPNARGFSASKLWRMMQFFETYRGQPILATLLRELPWSHNLAIMSRAMSPALVAEYQTCLPDKKLLQAKLHEFYQLAQEQAALPAIERKKPLAPQRVKPRKGRGK